MYFANFNKQKNIHACTLTGMAKNIIASRLFSEAGMNHKSHKKYILNKAGHFLKEIAHNLFDSLLFVLSN